MDKNESKEDADLKIIGIAPHFLNSGGFRFCKAANKYLISNFAYNMSDQPVILFDGVCNFCNGAVNFVIRRNKKENIFFAPLQSAAGEALLQQYGLPETQMQSFFFIENGKAYMRSTAALRVCRHLGALWPLCYFFIIVPVFIRDGIYNWIARNRYKWFGSRDACMVPSPEIKARFLN